jgi:hypothetical protein
MYYCTTKIPYLPAGYNDLNLDNNIPGYPVLYCILVYFDYGRVELERRVINHETPPSRCLDQCYRPVLPRPPLSARLPPWTWPRSPRRFRMTPRHSPRATTAGAPSSISCARPRPTGRVERRAADRADQADRADPDRFLLLSHGRSNSPRCS